MKITGIICEYNPLHLGHKKQLDAIRAAHPEDGIVCLMSGNYVQRGKPAIFDKTVRAKAAVLCGADLVLELPVTASLASAEGFASEGVRILGSFCHRLCFGAETGNAETLTSTAQALLSPAFSAALGTELDKGLSFPAARQAALTGMGLNGEILSRPNDILAVEYCKAIISQNSKMYPMPMMRQGDYHAQTPDPRNPSAAALRRLMAQEKPWMDYVPAEAICCFENAALHTISAGERAILAKLRMMDEADYEALPYGSEGLWRKLMHAAATQRTLEDILTAAKSKRYTRTRLDRMVMCAFLGLTAQALCSPAPYARVLALNDTGRQILKQARQAGSFPNIGQRMQSPYQAIENRCDSLYGLFCAGSPDAADAQEHYRVQYLT